MAPKWTSWADAIRSGDFDGCWCGEDGEAIADILGQQITFKDGYVAKLESRTGDVLCMVLDGEVFSARLDSPGTLRWNDGDVWMLKEARRQKALMLSALKETTNLPSELCSDTEKATFDASLLQSQDSPSRTAGKVRKAPPSKILVGDPGKYRVLQGVVFKKPGIDPTTERGIRKVQEVGSTLRTTGRTWMGKHCSQWVELDSPGTPGWVLVQGQGVDMPGPLLQKVEVGEETPLILRIKAPRAEDLVNETHEERKFVLKPSALMREVRAWVSLLFKLKMSDVRICKPQGQRPSDGKYVVWHNLSHDEFVPDEVSVKEAGFSDGSLVQYTYLGFLPE